MSTLPGTVAERVQSHDKDYAAYCSQLGHAYVRLEAAQAHVDDLKRKIEFAQIRFDEAASCARLSVPADPVQGEASGT